MAMNYDEHTTTTVFVARIWKTARVARAAKVAIY
jgi:hypothetical protein